jgi:hypothetical protein
MGTNGDDAMIYANGKIQTPQTLVAEQQESGAVDTTKLAPGTKVRVVTLNTTYDLEIIDGRSGKVRIEGGHRFPFAMDVVLNGSTWGGSMLWVGRLGIGMAMELERPNYKPLLTSPIQSVTVMEAMDEPPRLPAR